MTILLICLAALAIHRIWHYEDIFSYVRSRIGLRVLLDPRLSPVWIIPIVVAAAYAPHGEYALAVFACYPFMRAVVWARARFGPQPAQGATCTPCQAKQRAMSETTAKLRSFTKRIYCIGVDPQQVYALAHKHASWAFTYTCQKSLDPHPANIFPLVINNPDFNQATIAVAQALMSGGNGTILTHFPEEGNFAHAVTQRLGRMMGFAWVHISRSKLDVPAHHRVVAPDEFSDTVLLEAQPPSRTAP